MRRDLIANVLDDNYATIMRQAFFTLFEQRAHTMIIEDASADELNRAYMENLKDQFGDSVALS